MYADHPPSGADSLLNAGWVERNALAAIPDRKSRIESQSGKNSMTMISAV
jgi:hypothetical protein